MKQKMFTPSFADELAANLMNNIALYRNDTFEIDDKHIIESKIDILNENLAANMEEHISSVASEELEAAKILFEAFPNLTRFGYICRMWNYIITCVLDGRYWQIQVYQMKSYIVPLRTIFSILL